MKRSLSPEDKGELRQPEVLDKHDVQEIKSSEEVWLVLRSCHDLRFRGYFGASNTFAGVRRFSGGKGWRKASSVARCLKCQKHENYRQTRMSLVVTPMSDRPFDKLYIERERTSHICRFCGEA